MMQYQSETDFELIGDHVIVRSLA